MSESLERLRSFFIGKPLDPLKKGVFEQVSLVAVLAWIGLGADGLSSACYGPAEAFHALGGYPHLAVVLVALTMATVFVLSRSQVRIVQLYPSGGGDYLVASRLLGPVPGLFSGSALIVDYILTIATSTAACCDAALSMFPSETRPNYVKVVMALLLVVTLTVLNLRGVRESIRVHIPLFMTFLVTHVLAILYGIGTHVFDFGSVAQRIGGDVERGCENLGFLGVVALILRAYTLGGGTYTGIEAVSNSVQTFREPKVETARKALLYMGSSLAFIAGGLLFCFLVYQVKEQKDQTLNATLLRAIADGSPLSPGLGATFVFIALLSEAALLFVASQAGMVSGPQVVANMALDRWLPQRFANLSDRLVAAQGITLFGALAGVCLILTGGSVRTLVVMYSINVFITFTLSQLGLLRHDLKHLHEPGTKREMGWILVAFIASLSLLVTTIVFKFTEGGWLTLATTGGLALVGLGIRMHYRGVKEAIRDVDRILVHAQPETTDVPSPSFVKGAGTAAVLVGGFTGLGVHTYLSIHRLFPNYFKNFYFLSVGTIGYAQFKSEKDLERLREVTAGDVQKFIVMARGNGFFAEGRWGLSTDRTEELISMCKQLAKEKPGVVFFMGKLVFRKETMLTWALHNHTADFLQRELHVDGLQCVVLPIRVG